MKVLFSLVSREQVVKEILDAMEGSIDRFSQDRSFDFKLVRIDQFFVPPTYEESFDDACMSYWSKKNVHPPRAAMEQALLYSTKSTGHNDALHYAAVLCRTGNFSTGAYWGGQFYHRVVAVPTDHFVRLDCRENINGRGGLETPTSMEVRRLHDFLPEMDSFSLSWVLGWANKEVALEGDLDSRYGRLAKEEFQRFRSGLMEVETLAQKMRGQSMYGEDYDGRRKLRQIWAYLAMQSTNISPYDGAGKHLAKLFEEMKTPSISA